MPIVISLRWLANTSDIMSAVKLYTVIFTYLINTCASKLVFQEYVEFCAFGEVALRLLMYCFWAYIMCFRDSGSEYCIVVLLPF